MKPVNEKQVALAARLDLEVESDSERVAGARIRDRVDELLGEPVRPATTGQVRKGQELKLDVLRDSFNVAWARIQDAIAESNEAQLQVLQLQHGDRVVVIPNGSFPARAGIV